MAAVAPAQPVPIEEPNTDDAARASPNNAEDDHHADDDHMDEDDDHMDEDDDEEHEAEAKEWDEGGKSHCGYGETVHETLMSIGESIHKVVGEPNEGVSSAMQNIGNWFQEASYAARDVQRGKMDVAGETAAVMKSVVSGDEEDKQDDEGGEGAADGEEGEKHEEGDDLKLETVKEDAAKEDE